MNLIKIKSREEHQFATWLCKTIRQSVFPAAFAQLWADSGIEQRKLIEIGAEIEKIVTSRDDNQVKAERLGRLAIRFLRESPRHTEAARRRVIVDMLFEWQAARRDLPSGDARIDWFSAGGYICGVAELAIATSMALGKTYETALAEVESDPNWLADLALPAIEAHGLSVSITDIKDTIRYGMTAHGRMGDWIVPEIVVATVESEAVRLARFLGVDDVRGMNALDVLRHLNDRVSEHKRRWKN